MKVSLLTVLVATLAVAGSAAVTAQPVSPAGVLPRGTVVHLMTMAPLSATANKSGDEFYLEVADDVSLNGVVIIPRGSPAAGHVYELPHTTNHKLGARVVAVLVNGTAFPVHGLVNIRATDLPSGTLATGATDRDMPVGSAL